VCVFVQIFLSYLNVYLGNRKKAFELIQEYDEKILNVVLNTWLKGIVLVFIGFIYKELGNISKSVEKFHASLSYAQESNYLKAQGLSLLGLAETCRDEKQLLSALSHHLKSIKILDQAESKCDLPEAYYQIGLTYQAMNEPEKSNENFQKAIHLFNEMEAPKQVERVRRSMQN
jgi:tetratricopeptide (TPR) repeat protein